MRESEGDWEKETEIERERGVERERGGGLREREKEIEREGNRGSALGIEREGKAKTDAGRD